MHSRVHATVAGLVQGVGFRWFVQQRALTFGLTGYVRNRTDGNVEFEAEGEREAVEQLLREVRTGPRSAQVTGLTLEWISPHTGPNSFDIR